MGHGTDSVDVQLGGVALSYSLLYLSLRIHQANRLHQHTLLSQQSILLNSVIEPLPPALEPAPYDVKRESLVETLKDRWNSEVEGLVRKAQYTDWNEVRERWETLAGDAWRRLSGSEMGERLQQSVVDSGEEVKQTVEQIAGTAKEGVPGEKRLLEIR